jgi:hypothetical protein
MKSRNFKNYVLVGTTPTRIAVANENRRFLTIKNDDSTNAIYYGENQNVATSGFHQGIKVSAGGQGVQEEYWTGEVWAISSSATSVSVWETHLIEEKGVS